MPARPPPAAAAADGEQTLLARLRDIARKRLGHGAGGGFKGVVKGSRHKGATDPATRQRENAGRKRRLNQNSRLILVPALIIVDFGRPGRLFPLNSHSRLLHFFVKYMKLII